MGTPEVPLEQAHETIEHHAHGASEPWVMGVALTAAVLAALAAVTALYAEHYANEAMLEQIKASDLWGEYQANSIKEKVVETKKELLASLSSGPSSKDEAKLAKYEEEKKGVKKEAEKLMEESTKHFKAHRPLSRGLTMFQVAIAIGAISVLTRRREFWFVCLAFGAVGVGFLVWGFVA